MPNKADKPRMSHNGLSALFPREYGSWRSMIHRCTEPKDDAWSYYGGRGISVCDRWIKSFENFLFDMEPKPTPKYTIERIDNNKNYEPNNCRWATRKEQQRNRRCNRTIECEGKILCVKEWAEYSKIHSRTLTYRLNQGWNAEDTINTTPKNTTHILTYNNKSQHIAAWTKELGFQKTTITDRLKAGWTVEKALSTPMYLQRKPLTYNGKTQLISAWAKELGINRNTLYSRIKQGWSVEKALS